MDTSTVGSTDFIAFDTETTGMWAPSHRIVEIAALRFRPGKDETAPFQTLINPGMPMPTEVIRVHGITDEMVDGAPKAAQVLPAFTRFCTGAVLVAHNAPFDIGFIGMELKRAELGFGPNPILDTVTMARSRLAGLESYSLQNLSIHFGHTTAQAHRALADAELVRRLFEKLVGENEREMPLHEFLAAQTVFSMSDFDIENAELPAHFESLARAIELGGTIDIVYIHPLRGDEKRTIRPKQVFRHGGRTYIAAFCEKVGQDRTFRLDRLRLED